MKNKPTKIKLEFEVKDDDPRKDEILTKFGEFLKFLQKDNQ